MDKPKTLPPDAGLVRLACDVNARLKGASVSFYLIQHQHGGSETGIIFQCGGRRALVKTRNCLGDGDADELVKSVNEWAGQIRPESKWTADPSEAA